MVSFKYLPNEIRVEIAQHIPKWADFQAFRQVDSRNLQLLSPSTDPTFWSRYPIDCGKDFRELVGWKRGPGLLFREMLAVAGVKWHDVPGNRPEDQFQRFRDHNIKALVDRLIDDDTKFDPKMGECDAGTIQQAVEAMVNLLLKISEVVGAENTQLFSFLFNGDTKTMLHEFYGFFQPAGGPDSLVFTMRRLLAKRLLSVINRLIDAAWYTKMTEEEEELKMYFYFLRHFKSFKRNGLQGQVIPKVWQPWVRPDTA